MVGEQEPHAFRARIHAKYRDEFSVHRDVAEFGEGLVAASRPLPSHVHVALDMFLTQAYKTHFGARLLAERAQAEDTATLTRRLMELAIQAIYIAHEDDPSIQQEKAGCYLAWLWRSAPEQLKVLISAASKSEWQNLSTQYGPKLPKGKSWGPTFKQMFEAAGLGGAYEKDYSLLSSIAHGSPNDATLHYSMAVVNLRSDLHVPVLLVFSSRYYLAVIEAWNHVFRRLDQKRFDELSARVNELRDKGLLPPAT